MFVELDGLPGLAQVKVGIAQVCPFGNNGGTSGGGATLGDFKGQTYGLGPLLGYILPLEYKQSLVFELKWLTELDTKKRLEGDFIWFKMVYRF